MDEWTKERRMVEMGLSKRKIMGWYLGVKMEGRKCRKAKKIA